MKITAIIERGSDGLYSVWSEQDLNNHGFGGYGENVEIAKRDFLLSVEEAVALSKTEGADVPERIETIFKYDLQSFFNYFDWINVSKFAQCAGINESKMRQYKTGAAFAGEATLRKILTAVKRMSAELGEVSFK